MPWTLNQSDIVKRWHSHPNWTLFDALRPRLREQGHFPPSHVLLESSSPSLMGEFAATYKRTVELPIETFERKADGNIRVPVHTVAKDDDDNNDGVDWDEVGRLLPAFETAEAALAEHPESVELEAAALRFVCAVDRAEITGVVAAIAN